MFSLTLCLINAICCRRTDVRRALEFFKYAEIYSYLDATFQNVYEISGRGVEALLAPHINMLL